MIETAQIAEIVKQYERHGWTLRRVLLCAKKLENSSPSSENSFGGALVVSSKTDALWFSRAAANGGESWELRRISGAPFALVKIFGANDDETTREAVRRAAEKALSEK